MMWNNEKRGKNFWIKRAVFIPIAIVAGVYLFGNLVMFLWNSILPAVFGFGTITFWQALGLLVLSKILFGGFSGHHGRRHSCHHRGDQWRHLTPEEKEKMKEEWRSRCRTQPEAE
ncbi:MAG: hypothetical protein Q8N05_03365 [Bacteroidota bacterium]|nr:hypothetical protein [Bacteroidota bacterium]